MKTIEEFAIGATVTRLETHSPHPQTPRMIDSIIADITQRSQKDLKKSHADNFVARLENTRLRAFDIITQ